MPKDLISLICKYLPVFKSNTDKYKYFIFLILIQLSVFEAAQFRPPCWQLQCPSLQQHPAIFHVHEVRLLSLLWLQKNFTTNHTNDTNFLFHALSSDLLYSVCKKARCVNSLLYKELT